MAEERLKEIVRGEVQAALAVEAAKRQAVTAKEFVALLRNVSRRAC